MSWLIKNNNGNTISVFRQLLVSSDNIIKIPGAHDAMAALLADDAQ